MLSIDKIKQLRLFTEIIALQNLIKIKELQKVQGIFISSIFKKNDNFLGINKFKIISGYTKKKIIALGGISKKNIRMLNLLNISGFAGISYFE